MSVSQRYVVAAAVACATALAIAPAAPAAPYTVDVCKVWESNAPAAVPSTLGVNGPNAIHDNGCGAGGVARVTVAGSAIPFTQAVGIGLFVPADRPNLTIAQLWSVFDFLPQAAAPNTGSAAFGQLFAGAQRVAEYAVPVAPAAPSRQDDQRVLPVGTRSVNWQVFCSTSASTDCFYPDPGVLQLVKARLFLDESVAPALTVTGGTLQAAGPRSGQQTLTFDAADADSGVASVTVSLDATVVAQATYPCPRTDFAACANDRAGSTLIADTTKVPDGSRVLTVVARDAAGNAVTRSAGTVTVANGPGPAAPNGAGASKLAKITARYTTTTKRSRTLRFTSSPTAKGTLLDEAGKPIAGAVVAVLARPRQAGADDAQVATATTGADGAFSLKVPSGPSRTITFAYTAFGGDPTPAATATLKTSVRALISARISPRSVRAGNSITVRGRLSLLPRRNVEVKIQARQGRNWRTIDDVRTTSSGAFRWRYRFPSNQARRTYAFRARVASQNYPFAAANSKPVAVRVR